MDERGLSPVRRSATVKCGVERAFRLFTERMEQWWPLRTNSVFLERSETCVFEGKVGGKIYEKSYSGEVAQWGSVLTWEPNQRVTYRWYPGRSADSAMEVDVCFSALPQGGTQIDLEHRGFERLGERAAEIRQGYDSGWEELLEYFFANAANKPER